jgi:hypothetical protein
MSTYAQRDRYSWIDFSFFYAFLAVLLTTKQIFMIYWGLSLIYPIVFAILAHRARKNNPNLILNIVRIPFIWLTTTALLFSMNSWPGGSDMYMLMHFSLPLFFFIFMGFELSQQKGFGRFASMPLALGSSLLLIGIIFVKQSFPNGRPIYWTGFVLLAVAMLFSIWRVSQKEDYCLRYFLWGLFLMIYVWLTQPLKVVSAEIIDAFFQLQ